MNISLVSFNETNFDFSIFYFTDEIFTTVVQVATIFQTRRNVKTPPLGRVSLSNLCEMLEFTKFERHAITLANRFHFLAKLRIVFRAA